MLKGKKFDAFALETTIKSPFKDLERTFKAFERTLQSTEQNFICGSQILVVWFNDFS